VKQEKKEKERKEINCSLSSKSKKEPSVGSLEGNAERLQREIIAHITAGWTRVSLTKDVLL
jgi:hypothetical protein